MRKVRQAKMIGLQVSPSAQRDSLFEVPDTAPLFQHLSGPSLVYDWCGLNKTQYCNTMLRKCDDKGIRDYESSDLSADGINASLLQAGKTRKRSTQTDKKRRLDLDHLELMRCPVLENQENLELLNLQTNFISDIGDINKINAGKLPYISFLDLYDNRIEHLPSALNSLSTLKVLMLGKNRIFHITNVGNLKNLDVLDLHLNFITKIENISSLQKLRVLNLSGNKIKSIGDLTSLESLIELDLHRNCIECINNRLDIIPAKLDRLHLSNNNIRHYNEIIHLVSDNVVTRLSCEGNPFCKNMPLELMKLVKVCCSEDAVIESSFLYRAYYISTLHTLKQLDDKKIKVTEREHVKKCYTIVKDKKEKKRSQHCPWKCSLQNTPNCVTKPNPSKQNEDHEINILSEHQDILNYEMCKNSDCGYWNILPSKSFNQTEMKYDSIKSKTYQTIYTSKTVDSQNLTILCRHEPKDHYKLQVSNEILNQEDSLGNYVELDEEILLKVSGKGLIDVLDHNVPWITYAATHLVVSSCPIEALFSRTSSLVEKLPRLSKITLKLNNIRNFHECLPFTLINHSSATTAPFFVLHNIHIERETNMVVMSKFFREFMAYMLPRLDYLNGTKVTTAERKRGHGLFKEDFPIHQHLAELKRMKRKNSTRKKQKILKKSPYYIRSGKMKNKRQTSNMKIITREINFGISPYASFTKIVRNIVNCCFKKAIELVRLDERFEKAWNIAIEEVFFESSEIVNNMENYHPPPPRPPPQKIL